jgi:glutamyl-Q tRNA(Asp) synthetase
MPYPGAGRFAPSPTGALHRGSLLTAVASWLDAKSQGLAWLLRFDDLDSARNLPGAEAAICRALEAHALFWDGTFVRQSLRTERYAVALAQLSALGLTYCCTCSRLTLAGTTIYPGTCRSLGLPDEQSAIRFRCHPGMITFEDDYRGRQQIDVAAETGDFVIRRRDRIFSYALATAVDDGDPEITRVVRGRDLLHLTGVQLALIDALGCERPSYAHLPLVVNSTGQKLSKQTRAQPLDDAQALANLRWTLNALGQPSSETPVRTPSELLSTAVSTWNPSLIPGTDITLAST